MADFLSPAWFESLNDTLANAGPVPLDATSETFRVVLEFRDGPSALPHALTFTMTHEGASVEPGDHLSASAVIRLTYDDAWALTSGTLESASALREGRMKVRGDVHTLVPLLAWLVAAHPIATA